MTPDQEKLLFEYLLDGKKARDSNSEKLDFVVAAQQRMYNELQLHFVKDEAKFEQITARVEVLEQAKENTGRYQMDELRLKLKEKEDANTWWKRWGIQTIVTVLLSAFAALLSAFITLLNRKSP